MQDVVARLTAALADRYRIERELGAGGMATVYLAPARQQGTARQPCPPGSPEPILPRRRNGV